MKKKIFSIFLMLLVTVSLVSCGILGSKKTFTARGLTIELTSEFHEQDSMIGDMYLQATKYGFISNSESKSMVGNHTLERYTELVLANTQSGAVEEIKEYSDDNVTFYYSKYYASVDGTDFGYFLVTYMTDKYYYTTNYFTLRKDLDKHTDKFFKWAKTVVIDESMR